MRLKSSGSFWRGRLGREIVEKFNHEIIGVDFSIVGLTGAKRRNPSLILVRADAHSLPFKDGSFDQVLSLDCLEHFSNQDKAVQEMDLLLMNNGELLLVVDIKRPILRLYEVTILLIKRVLRIPTQSERNLKKLMRRTFQGRKDLRYCALRIS